MCQSKNLPGYSHPGCAREIFSNSCSRVAVCSSNMSYSIFSLSYARFFRLSNSVFVAPFCSTRIFLETNLPLWCAMRSSIQAHMFALAILDWVK